MPIQRFIRFCHTLVTSTVKRKKCARQRFLLEHEWKRLRDVLDEQPPKVRTYFYLLLLEGSRMSEARYMEWDRIDLTGGIWYKPVTKNGKAQTLAMSPAACELLRQLPRKGRYVFPGECPDIEWSRTAVYWHWRKIKRLACLRDVQIRDIRRTLGTWMTMERENTRTLQTIFNHSDIRTTANVYSVVDLNVQRAALTRHADRVMAR